MRYLFLILSILMLRLSAISADPYPARYDGTMMPLQLETFLPPAPDSLQPVFVAHIGRHGARFMTSAKKVKSPLRTLRNAREITPLGRRFIALLQRLDSVTDGRWGELSAMGYAEEDSLAAQLSREFPTLFKNGRIKVWSSYVPRVVASAFAFCQELSLQNPLIDMDLVTGPQTDSLTRFFECNQAFEAYLDSGSWNAPFKAFSKAMTPTRPARAVAGADLTDKEAQHLTMQMRNVLASMAASGLEVSPAEYFTPEEWEACWQVSNLEHYLQRTANRYSTLPAEAAAPLLQAIISAIDTMPALGYTGSFWFGHAETVAPLLSLMDLPGCNAPSASVQEVSREWQDYDVIPLGANLNVVIYATPGGEKMAQIIVNGRQKGEIKAWKEVRNGWKDQILRYKQ